jgi:pyruvate formate-lyase activating enzyme-like uncharacterized protein
MSPIWFGADEQINCFECRKDHLKPSPFCPFCCLSKKKVGKIFAYRGLETRMAGVVQLDDSIEAAFSARSAHGHGLTAGQPQEPAKAIRSLGATA